MLFESGCVCFILLLNTPILLGGFPEIFEVGLWVFKMVQDFAQPKPIVEGKFFYCCLLYLNSPEYLPRRHAIFASSA